MDLARTTYADIENGNRPVYDKDLKIGVLKLQQVAQRQIEKRMSFIAISTFLHNEYQRLSLTGKRCLPGKKAK